MFLHTGLKNFPTFPFTTNCSTSFAAATGIVSLNVMETVSSPQRHLTEVGYPLPAWLLSNLPAFAKNLCSCSSHGLGELRHPVCARCRWHHWKPCLPEAVYLLYPQRNKAKQLSLHQLMGNTQLLHAGSNLSISTFLIFRMWISEVIFNLNYLIL